MTRVLAAIDDSAAADVVLATAVAFAALTAAVPEAFHVAEDGHERAQAIAAAAGVRLREGTGAVVDAIAHAASAPDVRAVVVGARRAPDGAQPVGHVAFALLTRLAVPLLVVPPDTASPSVLRRVLVPLDGTMPTAERARAIVELATANGLDVVVIHVTDPARLPAFTDQPQHETNAFTDEFLARYAPAVGVNLELRVGPPDDEVLAATSSLHADLVALAWAQVLQPDRARVVRSLLARSHVPLLLLPLTGVETAQPVQ
jgi:hypothetical protein